MQPRRPRRLAAITGAMMALVVLTACLPPPLTTVDTVAGGGPCCVLGDGGPATDATFSGPYGLAVAADGTVYVAEFHHRVRKIDTTGTITTLAGDGTVGFAGDGGPATVAQLAYPHGVAVTDEGIVYIAAVDRVRVVAGGVIGTVAGGGSNPSSDDGVAASDADYQFLTGLAVHPSGEVYTVEQYDDGDISEAGRVRRIWPGGGSIGGRVTTAGAGVGDVEVRIYGAGDPSSPVVETSSGGMGFYGVSLLTDDYLVEFVADGGTSTWWPDAPDAASAEMVEVGPGEQFRADVVLGAAAS